MTSSSHGSVHKLHTKLYQCSSKSQIQVMTHGTDDNQTGTAREKQEEKRSDRQAGLSTVSKVMQHFVSSQTVSVRTEAKQL